MNFSLSESDTLWLRVLLEERFGLRFYINITPDRKKLLLSLPSQSGAVIFSNAEASFYVLGRPDKKLGCEWWPLQEDFTSVLSVRTLPAPSSRSLAERLIYRDKKNWIVGYDILGLAYWAMNRLEEIGREDLDGHNRFSAQVSHAHRYEYLSRPVVDEWLDILAQIIQKQWPYLVLKRHQFSIHVSHDVDFLAKYTLASPLRTLKHLVSALIFRRDINEFVSGLISSVYGLMGLSERDPYNTYDWLMDVSEKNGITSAFYFICGRTNTKNDADYDLSSPVVAKLIKKIADRGHEIGLHPSYETYQVAESIRSELKHLKTVCGNYGIEQVSWGGRMHFLRWSQPYTLRACSEAGLSYDATLGYADSPGFRCGTCHEFTAYDAVNNEMLTLKIRPLIVMERSLFSDMYLGLDSVQAASDNILRLKSKCRKVGGQFVFLWHNSSLETAEERQIYLQVIEN